MAIIPNGQKMFTVDEDTNTTFSGSKSTKESSTWYTMQDVKDSIGSTGPAYKVYTASLTQDGTDAPVATVLEDTIGAIGWARSTTGGYTLTFETPIDLSKVYINGLSDWNGSSSIYLTITDGSTVKGYYNMYFTDNTTLTLEFQSEIFAYSDISTLMSSTSKLYLPEIRVYN